MPNPKVPATTGEDNREQLIQRHLERMSTRFGPERIEELLSRCALSASGGRVKTVRGEAVADEDCFNYKQAVRETFGEGAYSFAKVNFILGGCRCQDCAQAQGSPSS
jgi:hypothetical protein